jgi:hypothetical protein
MYGSNGRWGNATTNLPGSYQYVPYSETYFCRFMEMSLYKHETFVTVDKYDKAQAVWSSEAFSAGSSSDLRLVSDYLLVATFQYFGQDTGQRVQEMLHAKDKRVKALQEAVASTQPAP